MLFRVANNARTTLAAPLSTSATSLSVATGEGSRFPALGPGEYFHATLIDGNGNIEIVRVTARSGDAMTVTRGAEGTPQRTWAQGARLEQRVTAALLEEAVSYTPHDGAGTVRSVRAKLRERVSAHDFGAVGDGVTDDTAALQAFLSHVTTHGLLGTIPSGDYVVTSPLEIAIGSLGFRIEGMSASATRIMSATTFAGGDAVVRITGSQGVTSWWIGGFMVRPHTLATRGSAAVGIRIGDPSVATIQILGFQFSKIADVMVYCYDRAWSICHARMIYFDRCGAWNDANTTANTCLLIEQNGAFTGDLVFDKCQFVTAKSAGNRNLHIYSPVGPYGLPFGMNSICGIKFRSCDFYVGYTSIEIFAQAQSYVADIWFVDGCQQDGESYQAVYVESKDAGTRIEDLHFEGMYVSKSTETNMNFASTGTGGFVRSIWIEECIVMDAPQRAISFFGVGCADLHVNSNTILDCDSSGGAIQFNGATRIACNHNIARTGLLDQKPAYLIWFSSGTNHIVALGNSASGMVTTATIHDQSGAVTKAIANNLG